ncbi:MAG: PilZ domain-containing protein [Terracidiphilus sp.]
MAEQRRRNPRFECAGTAGVQLDASGVPCLARIANLSAEGCLIVFNEPHRLSQDTIVELTFRVDDLKFRVWGQVRAIRSDRQIGFQFPLLSARVRGRIEDLIAQLIEDFLIKSSSKDAVEKRRHTRISCMGSAGIQMRTGETFYPAKIVNLSAGGCLMELQEPQSLTQDAKVELTFQINNLPFHVPGQVSGTRAHAKVGFQFPLLSQKVRRQLEDLVEELIVTTVKRFVERKEMA